MPNSIFVDVWSDLIVDPDLGVEELLLDRLNEGVLIKSSESEIEIKFGAAVAADDAFI